MEKRGRKSAAALAVASVSIVATMERPKCPHDLSDEESEIWWSVVNRLPADWFPDETHPLLAQYCRHVVQSRRIAELIERASGDPDLAISAYDRLLKMQERESRAIASLSTKMRISQQTTYDKSRKKGTTVPRKPWD